jgi:hypothetical protein
MALGVAVRAILATSRSTDEHAAHRPTLGPQHAVAKRQTTGETLGRRLPHKKGE